MNTFADSSSPEAVNARPSIGREAESADRRRESLPLFRPRFRRGAPELLEPRVVPAGVNAAGTLPKSDVLESRIDPTWLLDENGARLLFQQAGFGMGESSGAPLLQWASPQLDGAIDSAALLRNLAAAAGSDTSNVALLTDLAHQLGLQFDGTLQPALLSPNSTFSSPESQAKTPSANVIHVGSGGISVSGSTVPPQSTVNTNDIAQAGQTLYSTGFESSEGFTAGFIANQNNWTHYLSNTTQPVISTAAPQAGTQHFRIGKEAGLGQGTSVGGFTPSIGAQAAGHYQLNVDVSVTAVGGADYYIVPISDSQNGNFSGGVRLDYQGNILVLADLTPGDSTYNWVDSGFDWAVGQYRTVTIDLNATTNTLTYSYGGTQVYSTVVFASTSMERVILVGDNYNLSDVGNFDNVRLDNLSTPTADLTGVRLGNWNNFIPVDTVQHAATEAHAYDGVFYDNQTLYFNWASDNIGNLAAAGYTVRAEVTGTGGAVFSYTGISTDPGNITRLTMDQAVGPLAAGTHTIRIWLDHADTVGEVSELQNYYERTITVLPAGTPAAQTLTPKQLGVSPGVSWVHTDGQIANFGGEKVYSVDLVAGQRISAAVQSPTYGGSQFNNFTDLAIPDNGTQVISSLTVSGALTISDIDVVLSIDHRNAGDIRAFLVSPGGTSIELSTGNGSTGNHYLGTTFDDEAAQSISDPTASAPFTGHYRPEALLSSLDGTNAAGTWQLKLTDSTGQGTAGKLLEWGLRINGGLDSSLTITGPGGVLAFSSGALSGLVDPGVSDIAVPTTGTYLVKVGNENANIGAYSLEVGIFDASLPGAIVGATTNLDPLRASNGNVAVLGHGSGVSSHDLYTITLNAGEAVTIGATTPGGFYGPNVRVTGPNGFDAGLPYAGPGFDSMQLFTAPATGTYTLNVGYATDANYLNVISTGTYVLTVALSDTANNNSLAAARPISPFDYRAPHVTTSLYFGVTGQEGVWRGSISAAGDADYFGLGHLSAGELIRVVAQREGASQVYPLILLANSAGQVVNLGQPYRSGGLEGVAFFETIVSSTDDYFAVVIGDATQAGGATLSTGAYDLFYAGFGAAEDAYENNDSRAQVDAAPAGLNSPKLGTVGEVTVLHNLAMMEDSEDWFRFDTAVTGGRNDYVRVLFSHAQGNLNLDLLDENGNLLRRSQGLSDNELVSLQGLPADTYYARVWGLGGARNPHYDLRIQTGAPADRLTSAPFTTDAQYSLQYQLGGGSTQTSAQTLKLGANELVVSKPRAGDPFELVFNVTRVGTMADYSNEQYDLLGNLSRTTDALNRDTIFQYDGLGRMTLVDGPVFGDASQFFYDGNNNMVKMVDAAAGTTDYTYDELNRLTAIILPNGQGTVGYAYDLAGRVTSISYPGGTVVNYGYDAAGRLGTVTEGTNVTSYTYYADGMLHTETLPNGITGTSTYDDHGRLIDLTYTKTGGAIVTGYHYTLDGNGNRTVVEVHRANAGTPDPSDYFTSTYQYQYDALNRLTRAEYPDAKVVVYTYDDNGNRLSTSTDPDGAGPQPAVVENYHYGYDNRLESITGAAGAVVKQFYYDPRGNVVMQVTPAETVRYEYDYRNMLLSVEDGTHRTEYVYDGRGDRVARLVDGVRTNFVNDPNQEYTQVLMELNVSGAVQAKYTYGDGRISGVLPGQTGAAFYLADALGSTSDLTGANGTLLQSYSYDAFGALRSNDPGSATGPVTNEMLFAGEQYESVTGLLHLRAREYNQALGRFLSKDPADFIDGANLYIYVLNNPIGRVDPTGESWLGDYWDAVNRQKEIARAEYGRQEWLERTVGTYAGPLAPGMRADLINLRRYQGISPGGAGDSFSKEVFRHMDAWFGWNTVGARFSGGGGSSGGAGASGSWGSMRGGVLLDRAVDFIGDLGSITSATVDPVTHQVVLVGNGNSGGSIPDLRMDDFVAAIRAIYASAEDPGVTLDPQKGHESDPSYPQLAHLFGGLDDTDAGWVLLEADRVMKTLVARRDNVSGATVTSSVGGYKSVLDRWFDRLAAGDTKEGSSRFWFVPSDVKLVRADDGSSFVFDRTAVQLLTEDQLIGNGATDPDAKAFAQWFTTNYAAIAQENYTVYDYPNETVGGELASQTKIFTRLEQVAKAIAFVRFLRDNNIPIDFSWLEHYVEPVRNTPLEAKTVQNTRSETIGNRHISITVTGGVTMDTPNTYLSGADGLQGLILGSRPNELAQQWAYGTQTAVALSLDSDFVDGLARRGDMDLMYKTPGDIPFGLTRYYNSAEPVAGPFGFGWELVPADGDFTMPKFFSSSRSSYTFLNGLHSGEVRINDLTTGKVLTFESSFDFRYGSVNNFGLNTDGVPTFTPGGSEMPDGSTLTQQKGTLNYTLGKPDGTKMIFDADGHLLEVQDSHARAITYGYTAGKVTSVRDSAGQTIVLGYDAQGHVTQATGLGGETVTYTYTTDGLSNLASADRVRGGTHSIFSYAYNASAVLADDDHRLATVTTPDRVQQGTTLSDIFGRTTLQTDTRGNNFQHSFDQEIRTTTTTDAINGTTTKVQTDSLGRTLVETDQLGRTTYNFYDVKRVYGAQYPNGWTYVQFEGTNRQPSLVKTPDPSRPWLYYEFDTKGNVTRIEDTTLGGDANNDGIDDHPRLFEYDTHNNVTKETDARGFVTTHTYNAANQPLSTTHASGTPHAATESWTYEPLTGWLASQTDAAGVKTSYVHDTLGNVIRQTVAEGTSAATVTEFTYDAFSRKISMKDGMNRITRWTYDGRDQVLTTTLEGAVTLVSSSSYEAASGRKLTDTDFNGKTTAYSYNATTGDLLTQTGALGTADETVTKFSYDRFGNIQTVTDPVGNITTFAYDELQRMEGKTSLGSTARVVSAAGSNADIAIGFSAAMQPALIANGTDVIVTNSLNQTVAGAIGFSADGRSFTWTAAGAPLAADTYKITLRASGAGDFTTTSGQLLDGEYFGATPSGNNTAGGDFVYTWLVDDHGNDAAHATPTIVPSSSSGTVDFGGDADWFKIDATAGSRFQFEVVLGSIAGSLSDSTLALYDLDGTTVLQFNDDIDFANGRYGSRIEWEAPRTGSYYLKVAGYSSAYTGSYQLNAGILADDYSDTPAGATLIQVAGTTAGTLEVATDKDTFSFQAAAGQKFRITTILGTLADSTLKVFGTDKTTVLAANDDFFNGNPAAFIYWTAPAAGTYYVQVGSKADSYKGTYELAISNDDHGDYSAVATSVGLNTQTPGNLEVKFDPDWFSFAATAGVNYHFAVVGGTLSDPFLALFDANGVLKSNDNFHGANPDIYWQAAQSGTYFLKVTGQAGAGTYTLNVDQVTDDHGNTTATSTAITLPSTTNGRIDIPPNAITGLPAGDSDWFRFTATQGKLYRFETILGSLADSKLRLYAADGVTILDENDDAGSLASRILWQAPTTGLYYLEVVANGNTSAGTYQLAVAERETVPPVGSLAFPLAGSLVTTAIDHVDITWTDTGSGIERNTIDLTDITITGVTVTGVAETAPGSNVWRYTFAGTLPEGPIQVTLLGLHVADHDGNFNDLATQSFTVDVLPPAVSFSAVAPDPRLTPISQITISFSEVVSGFDLSDLVLKRNGTTVPLTGVSLTTTNQKTWLLGSTQSGDLSSLTAAAGSYALTLTAAGSGIIDAAAKPLTAGASEGWDTYAPAEIRGKLFEDRNENGQKDAGEPVLTGWMVYLDLDNDRQRDPAEPSTTSDASGNYVFGGLLPGTYTVAQEPTPGWIQTHPGPGVIANGAQPLGAALPVTTTGSDAPVFAIGSVVEAGGTLQPSLAQSASLINLDDFRNDPRFAGITGKGYSTVIIDTGIDLNHPFFGPDANSDGVADRIIFQYDFADGDADASDVEGHGSNVASIVGSQDLVYRGMAPEANLIVLKVFKNDGSGNFTYVENALQWVVAHAAAYNIVSVNLSLGDSGNYAAAQSRYGLGDELASLANMGVITVSAAGNDFYQNASAQGVSYPAADPYSLSIGAVYDANIGAVSYAGGAVALSTAADRVAPFSQRSLSLTSAFAPGAAITGAGPTGNLVTMHGTSQASPHIAGIAVLADDLAMNVLGRRLTFAEFAGLLRTTGVLVMDGDDENDNVVNTNLAYPRVDVMALGEAILSMSGPAPGTYSITLTAGQSATNRDFGNLHLTSATPSAPDLVSGSDTGALDTDNLTSRDNSTPAKQLQFSVSNTVVGATVKIFANGTLIGSAVATGTSTVVTTDGAFDLADGAVAITSRQLEPFKLESVESSSLGIAVDTVAPTLTLTGVTPDPRDIPVSSLSFLFSQKVAGFDLGDLLLTRNGGSNLLTGAQTLTSADFTSWTLSNLAALTGGSGTYQLALNAGSGIADLAGNLLAGSASQSWVVKHAPVLDNSGAMALGSVLEDAAPGNGTLVKDLIASAGGDRITDVDLNPLEGIAVIGADTSNGRWEYSSDGGAHWTDFGAVTDAAARLLASDPNTTRVRFLPGLNFNGSVGAGLTFRAWDQTAGTAGGAGDASINGGITAFSTATETASILITPVNDAPLRTAGSVATLGISEDSALTSLGLGSLSYAPGGGADENAQSLTYKVTTVPAATLGTVYLLDGTTVVTAGSTYSIGALRGMRFRSAPNANGTASFGFEVQDSGGTLNGGVDKLTESLVINVSAVNDAPARTAGTAGPVTVLEDSGLSALGLGSIAYGPGGGGDEAAQSLSYRVTALPLASFGAVFLADGTTSVTAGSYSLAALRGMRFRPAPDAAGTGSFGFEVQDSGGVLNGGQDTLSESVAITVTGVNDAPVLIAGAPGPLAVREDAGLISLGLGAVAFGPGGGGDEAGQTLGYQVTALPAANLGSVFLADGATLVTLGSYSAASLQGMRFQPATHANGTGSFSFQVQDDGGTLNAGHDSLAGSIGITVSAVNDAPERTGGAAGPVTVLEDSGLSSLGLGTLAYGPGGGSDEAAQNLSYQVTALPAASLGKILLADGTTPLTVGTHSLAELRGLQFQAAADAAGTVTFSFQAIDDGGTLNGGEDTLNESVSITVSGVNDAPQRTAGTVAPLGVSEDSGLTSLGLGAVDFRPGGGSDEAGQTLGYQITALPDANLGSIMLADGTTAVTLGSYSLAQLRGMGFRSGANASGTTAFSFLVQDSGGTSNGGADALGESMAITVDAVNDAPVISGPATRGTLEDASVAFSSAGGTGISIADADAGGQAIQVTLAVNSGLLTLGSTVGLSFANGDGTGDAAMTITGTLTDINHALDGLIFAPTKEFFGIANLTITANDQGNAGSGGALGDAHTFPVTVSRATEQIILKDALRRYSFLDEDGTPVTVVWTGPGQVTLERYTDPDDHHGDLRNITVDGSTITSALTIATKGVGAKTSFENLVVHGPLKSLAAGTTDLLGDITIDGSIATLTMSSAVSGSAISIGPRAALLKTEASLTFDRVAEMSVTSATPLNVITAAEWLDRDGVADALTAPSLKKLIIKGDKSQTRPLAGAFEADITLTNGALIQTLASVSVAGPVGEGVWSIAGNTGSITALSTAPNWNASFAGKVTLLKTTGSMSGHVTAKSIATVYVGGDLTNATLALTQGVDATHPTTESLHAVTIRGMFDSSDIVTAGHIGSATIGAMRNSHLLAGLRSPQSGLADSLDDFESAAKIGRVTILGLASALRDMADSSISARFLGSLTLRDVKTDNAGLSFGLAADRIASLIVYEGRTVSKRLGAVDAPGEDRLVDFVVHTL
jgi:RHS repeat-associated protein